jgi:hypothetical protein
MAFKKREIPKPPPNEAGNVFGTRVFVATPAYDGRVLTDYAISLAETCLVGPFNDCFVQASVMGNGAFIDVARDHFVRMFLESNCTHLFFIDADLRWEPKAFLTLALSGKPICAGAYPKRQDPEEYPVKYAPNPDGTIQCDKDGCVLAERVPGGFLCIRRDVIERMVAEGEMLMVGTDPECPLLFYEKFEQAGPKKKRLIGEDFAFCDDYCRIFGEPIPVFQDIDFIHGGRFKGNFHQFLLKKSAEQDAMETSTAA